MQCTWVPSVQQAGTAQRVLVAKKEDKGEEQEDEENEEEQLPMKLSVVRAYLDDNN